MTTNVLFICEHSAGKSLLGATYFRAAAARAGIDVSIEVAGPDPDEINIPRVQQALENQGYTIGWHPKRVTESLTDAADIIVSVGCDHTLIPTTKPITTWDAPMISDDLDACADAIHAHAEDLARSLVP